MIQVDMSDPGSTAEAGRSGPSPLGLLDIAVYYLYLLHLGLIERRTVVSWADAMVMQVAILPNWILTVSLGSQRSDQELLTMLHDAAELRHMRRGFQLLCASLIVTKPTVAISDEPLLERMYSLSQYLFDEDVHFQLCQCNPCHTQCYCCWEHIPNAYTKLLQYGLPVLEYRVPGSITQPVQFFFRYQ